MLNQWKDFSPGPAAKPRYSELIKPIAKEEGEGRDQEGARGGGEGVFNICFTSHYPAVILIGNKFR